MDIVIIKCYKNIYLCFLYFYFISLLFYAPLILGYKLYFIFYMYFCESDVWTSCTVSQADNTDQAMETF